MTYPMGLDPRVVALVLLAAVLHASWNAILKATPDRFTATGAMNVVHFVIGGAVVLIAATPAPASWVFILLSTLIHFGYYTFLLGSYRFGDLSQVYPLSRGSAPLIVALLSPWMVGERLSPWQLGGVALLCLGILSLAFNRLRFSELFDWRPVSLALANGATIAAYTMADAVGVRQSGSPAGYIGWLFVLEGISMLGITAWVRGRDFVPAMRGCWKQGGLAGALSLGAYGTVIWCYSLGAVAPIAALRETSVVIAAAIGTFMLGEPFGRWRIIAASCCAVGILAINWAGR